MRKAPAVPPARLGELGLSQAMRQERMGRERERLADLERELADPQTLTEPERLRLLNQQHAESRILLQTLERHAKLEREWRDQCTLRDDPQEDAELRALAEQEMPQLERRLSQLEGQLHNLLAPRHADDGRDVVLEIRAGSGGDEAALFAGDLWRMYEKFADQQRWQVGLLSCHAAEVGGFKELIAEIRGQDVYRHLKFESGVHRVQRVPKTEAQGRLHTSAVSVAVLPEADAIAVQLQPQDLKIDVFRASGPGGQSVNTTDSAVRVTHLPSGITAQSQDEKSQHRNKTAALKVLRARLQQKLERERQDAEDAQRKSMIGSGDRSERIRTYNFPQSRVTDHRIGLTLYQLPEIMLGRIEPLVQALQRAEDHPQND